MDLHSHPILAPIAARQHGVLSTAQLSGFVTRSEVRAQLDARRWQRVARGVIATHNGDLSNDQRVRAALLQCPPGSAISGPTAAGLDGVRDIGAPGRGGRGARLGIGDGSQVYVSIPCGHRCPKGIDAEVHWSRFLGDVDVHPVLDPRRTRVPRSVLDWAAWQTADRDVRRVVLAAVQQRRTSADQLRRHLPRRGPCLHHLLIVESIDDAEGGIASLPERDFDVLVRAAGLPQPSRQEPRRRPSGRWYLDASWERYRYAAEIEGAHHFEVEHRDGDLGRLNRLVIAGDRVRSSARTRSAESPPRSLSCSPRRSVARAGPAEDRT